MRASPHFSEPDFSLFDQKGHTHDRVQDQGVVMPRFRAIVEIELVAPSEDEVDDIIHASVELDGELPPDSTVWTKEVKPT